jgi:hypothetical protein
MCFSRYRFSDIIPVSELEKKAESRMSPARMMNSAVSDVSFKTECPYVADKLGK